MLTVKAKNEAVVADLHHFDEEQDLDPNQSRKPDPEPHQSKRPDSEPHYVEKKMRIRIRDTVGRYR
jgi:hypothetical protein